ncbi:MAG: alpha/beta hydrolase, partial [Verrucomicrobiota bacterium]
MLKLLLVFVAAEVGMAQNQNGPAVPDTVEKLADLTYKEVDGINLQLDLYRPKVRDAKLPVVVWVHGGGWKNGSKKKCKATWLAEKGYAVASINYRLTDVAQWPAQIDDCHDSVRWLKSKAAEYGLDAENVGVWGSSAGGHLVALMGTRPTDEGGQIDAVCDWFGPTELLTMPPNNVGNGRTEEDIAKSNGAKLLGATVRDVPDLARDASALDHVSRDD